MKKLMIYPYNMEFSPGLRHRSLIEGFEISCVVSVEGFGNNGKDSSYADLGEKMGFIVEGDFEKGLENCDAVLFVDYSSPIDISPLIFENIIKAARAGKDILCTINFEEKKIRQIEEVTGIHDAGFTYFKAGDDELEKMIACKEYNIEKIDEIETPVIFVMGLLELTNKFEVQLALREQFIRKGYRVSQIGSRSYCKLTGFHSFPSFMLDTGISESKKVVMFNQYIKLIEYNEKPDIIIIGIPGGVMPYNRRITNKFGILAFEVCNAVTPDASVLCLSYNKYNDKFLSTLKDSLKHKLGVELDCFVLSNVKPQIDNQNQDYDRRKKYLLLDMDYMEEEIGNFSNSETPVYNALKAKDIEAMTNQIIEKLSDDTDIQII